MPTNVKLLIVSPMFIMLCLSFIYSLSLSSKIDQQQYLLNCPYPVFHGNIVFGNPQFIGDSSPSITSKDTVLNYTVSTNATQAESSRGAFFECSIGGNGLPAVSVASKNYGATLFNTIPYGWYAWAGDTVYTFFGKLQPNLVKIYLYFDAPAQVTGFAFFTFIQGVLLSLVSFGIFLVARGGGS